MTRIFFDTEFMEDGEVILPLSLGFVAETGERLYVEITDTDRSKANDWVKENVLPHLIPLSDGWNLDECGMQQGDTTIIQCVRRVAGARIKHWVKQVCGDEPPEFWADFGSYDWVVLCQLFGRMIDLPEGWPMFVRDIQQMKDDVGARGTKLPEVEGTAHRAIDDAINVQQRWAILTVFEERTLAHLRAQMVIDR